MLNRLTVSALLKTVILVTSFCLVIGFSLNAWDAWGRLQAASRIAQIADASANMFKAMHNLRTDRSTTNRLLNGDAPMDADIEKYLRNIRDTEMPAMNNALGLLGGIEFAQQATLVPEFERLFKTMTALQKEFWEAMGKPKAERRPTLAKEYMDTTSAMLSTLDRLSGMLAAAVNHQDAMIDQLLAIKQIAWLLRNTGGEASLIVSNALGTGKAAPETRVAFTKFNGGADAAWSALELTASGMQLPPAISSAMAATKTAYFEPQYLSLRERLLTQIASGEKAEMTANQWTPITVGRLSAAVGVAEPALDAAKGRAAHLRSTAQRSLVTQLALLIGALALALGAQMIVARRVIKPLHTMRDAMLKVAAGDLAVDTGYAKPRARTKSARWPAHWRPSSSRPPTRCGSKRRSASATPAPRRGSRQSKATSANSRAWCARRSTSSARLPARCGPPRPVCRRCRARPTRASRRPKRHPARLR